ncbi:hypothetical protein L1277_001648 [Okibacterium sp. HSC-33S16]|uniref:glycosyltransferase n=1 Tax=Okibacterium sp. HSC-33S16 TaxID=2910965 RepID=UPI0020A09876|nr:glycosyltransferase [Okibacterium sp. HSC-33S16]MCP2031557.1 hypothetical protein [Okibacterium sp. HSC-33S16]
MTAIHSMDHVFLTRFNVPSPGVEQFVRAKEGWLERRSDLFEEYCLPSMRHQTARNISWIIYFDPQSPDWFKARVKEWSSDGTFRPIYRTSVSPSELMDDIRSTVGSPSSLLLTTNLDNDDGLATDFAARLQAAGQLDGRTALYLADGLIISNGRTYRRTDRDNAFCSVVESWESPVTCWIDAHNMLNRTMPVRSVSGPPAWLQVVHGGNVSNSVHGRMVSPEPYGDLFPGLLNGLTRPTASLLLRENFVAAPVRSALHVLRTSARKVVVLLFGRTGLDRLKYAIASQSNIRTHAR